MLFNELKEYLYTNSVFGLTATIRKKVLIYHFKRFYNGIRLQLRIKVDKDTKEVLSVENNGKVYTSFDDIKGLVENKYGQSK